MADKFVAVDGINNNDTNIDGSGFDRGSLQYPYAAVTFAMRKVSAPGDIVWVIPPGEGQEYTDNLATGGLAFSGTEANPCSIRPYGAEYVRMGSKIDHDDGDWWEYHNIIFDREVSESLDFGDTVTTPYVTVSNTRLVNCRFENKSDVSVRLGLVDGFIFDDCEWENNRGRALTTNASAISTLIKANNVVVNNPVFIDQGTDCFIFGNQNLVHPEKSIDNWEINNAVCRITKNYKPRDNNGDIIDPVPSWGGYVGENALDCKYGTNIHVNGMTIENYRATTPGQDDTGNIGFPIVCHLDFVGPLILNGVKFVNCCGAISCDQGEIIASGIVVEMQDDPIFPYALGGSTIDSVFRLTNDSANVDLTQMHIDCKSNVYNFIWSNVGTIGSSMRIYNNAWKGDNASFYVLNSPAPDCDYNAWPASIDIASEFQGANDLTDDPLTEDNGIPAANSPLYHAGKVIRFGAKDFQGRRFHVPPTIGAYEFTRGSPAQTRTVRTSITERD